jgi:predicted ATPase
MLKRIRIQNFKSLVDVTIDLAPLTVFIGRSGTGKTNVIDALRFLDHLLHAQVRKKQQSLAGVVSAATKHTQIAIEVDLQLPPEPRTVQYEIVIGMFHNQSSILIHERLSVGGETIFQQMGSADSPHQWNVKPPVISPPDPGSIALGSIHGLPIARRTFLHLTRGLGCYDFPGDVLKSETVPSTGSSDEGGLDDDAQNFLSVYRSILADFTHPERSGELLEVMKQVSPLLMGIDPEQQQAGSNQQRVWVGLRVGGADVLTLQLSQQSEGFRRFFAHLLALYQIPPKATACFEEPEKGIYPAALAALAEQFGGASRSGTQVVLTTHSPELLDHFDPEAFRVFDLRDYATIVGRLASDQVQSVKRDLLFPRELLKEEPARIDDTSNTGGRDAEGGA